MPRKTSKRLKKAGLPSKKKAGEILRHGEMRGRPLTDAQEGLFGLIRGGGFPSRRKKRKKK